MPRAARPRLSAATAAVLVLALLPGCEQGAEPDGAALQLWFAALNPSCSQTINGSGSVPEVVQTLAVVLHPEGSPAVTHRKSRAAVNSAGFWEISGLLATPHIDLEVYGCDADGKTIYGGRSNGATIVDQAATSTHVFLAPVAQLTCTGAVDAKANDGQGHLYQPASLSRIAQLDDGDVVVTGGLSAWNGVDAAGQAGGGTAVYEHQGGFFHKGPDLLGKRAMHHAHGLDGRRVLVAGGVTGLDQQSIDLFGGAVLAPSDLKGAHPAIAAELVDVGGADGPPGVKESPVNIGTGARFLSSSIDLGDQLLFVGGVDDDAAASKTITRVGALGDVAAGGKGTSESFEMAQARAAPALLAFADGTVVIWGGPQSKASAHMGELLVKGASKTTALAVSGPKALLDDANLTTYGAAAAVLRQTGDDLWFVVAGGQPFNQQLRADGALAYVVQVNTAGTAAIKTLTLSSGVSLRAGIASAATRLPSGQVLFAGGLLAPLAGVKACADQPECLINDVALLEAPADMSGEAVELIAAMPAGQLNVPGFGLSAAPLPAGALLVGGQTTVVDPKAKGTSALDPTARVVFGAPSADQQAAICGK